MVILRIIKRLLVFSFLTMVTQVGGLTYIVSHIIYSSIKLKKLLGYKESLRRISFHTLIYLMCTFFIIPPIAGIFGRVPLPLFPEKSFGPRTIWTVILNRNYVRPLLKETALKISSEMAAKHSGIRINYFEANHPFFKGYPLIPHLSHSDGKKLDIGFIYNDSKTGNLSSTTPSIIGYGISEEPLQGEYNRPLDCGKDPKNWAYNFMNSIYPQQAKQYYQFNISITKELISSFSNNKVISKIFLEPHLKSRLGLRSGKISQVQCGTVRHDDHFHVQLE